jgi:hypothetical protein
VLNLLLRASFAPDIPNSDIPKPSKTPEEWYENIVSKALENYRNATEENKLKALEELSGHLPIIPKEDLARLAEAFTATDLIGENRSIQKREYLKTQEQIKNDEKNDPDYDDPEDVLSHVD